MNIKDCKVKMGSTVRNLSKTLVYGVEIKSKGEHHVGEYAIPWAARHAAFVLNRFVVRKGSTPFEVLFDREYKGAVSNLTLVSTRKGIVKCRTMRQCTPLHDIEVLAEATGTPWNYVQDTLVGRKPTNFQMPHAMF